MKKLLMMCAAIMFVLMGCEVETKQSEINSPKKEYLIKNIVDSCLVLMPNMMNNDATKKDFSELLKMEMQKYCGMKLPYLNEIPLQYEMCLPYDGTDYYVVKFSTISDKMDFDAYELTFQVFSKIHKKDMVNLIDKKHYFIDGIFIDFANNSKKTGFVLPSGRCLTDYPKVWKSALWDRPCICLGTLIIDNLEYKLCNY